jgi:hypothetical protein
MLLKTIRELSEIGALDMVAITGVPMPRENRTLGDRPASLSVKETGELLEALEHIARHFKEKAQLQNQPSTSERN